MSAVKLLTLDPGHFHAALVQKEMYEDVHRQVHVYAPLGADLIAHLQRIAGFNTRADKPTAWELEVHTGPDYLERLKREKPGNVVVLSGRNRPKIDRILAALDAGLHVLADKPWIINEKDLPKLETALARADEKRLIALDIMTERHEVTSILQRELVQDAETFGKPIPGTAEEPGVFMESVHFLLKRVAGVPLRRPPWFFDVLEQGEALADVGTHLVDLVPWILFPEQPIDPARDIQMLSARRWPTTLTRADFQEVTGEATLPNGGEKLDYFCNNFVAYQFRGIHVHMNIRWDLQAAAGAGDTHLAVVRGSRSRVDVRQGAEQKYRPEVYVVPNQAADRKDIGTALARKVAALQDTYPGLAVREEGFEFCLHGYDAYRISHEAHFAQVTSQFLRYFHDPTKLPAWERPNMIAKYFVTTRGVRMGQ